MDDMVETIRYKQTTIQREEEYKKKKKRERERERETKSIVKKLTIEAKRRLRYPPYQN